MYLYVQSHIQCTYLQFYIILYKYMKYIHVHYMYNPTYNVLIYNFTNYMKLYMCVCVCVYVCDIVTTTEDK